jgi:multicomponent K+:H+ antiporter subunit C
MEEVIAIAIGVLAASGVWLILRRGPSRVMGLCLLSYGVNLFIFSMGSLFIGKEPIIKDGVPRTCCTTPTRCRRRWCSRPSSSASP